ncbi:MAG: hypothetical protein H0W28_00230 [Pyrinomonadaceae bacterium]|nr:hypothetical protein [Pyrinomonadaceae bacterium]
MIIRILSSVFVVGLLLAGLASPVIAQTRRGVAATTRQSLLAKLPASDAVAQVNVKRVLAEALPKLLAGNSARLAEVDSHIEQFKTRTSLDLRSFDEIALGMRYSYPKSSYPSLQVGMSESEALATLGAPDKKNSMTHANGRNEYWRYEGKKLSLTFSNGRLAAIHEEGDAGITKIHTVVVARGAFNTGAIAAAGTAGAVGKYREEKYLGKTIYIFTLDQQVKIMGLLDLKIRELAVTPIDANTLALGDVERVRNAVAASRDRRRPNAELSALATQDPNAIVGFAGNVTAELLQNLRIGNEAIAKDVAAVRQAYGSLALTEKDLEMLVAARTVDAGSARSLGDTVEGLKQFGALFTNRLSGIRGILARSALGNLKITTQGNEIKIRTAVAQSDVAPLVGGL